MEVTAINDHSPRFAAVSGRMGLDFSQKVFYSLVFLRLRPVFVCEADPSGSRQNHRFRSDLGAVCVAACDRINEGTHIG